MLDDEKSDAFIVISCIEVGLRAIQHHYPHLKHVIFQSDNAKYFAGKVTNARCTYINCMWHDTCCIYYHNEAAAGKNGAGISFVM